MKMFRNIGVAALALLMGLAGCEKADKLPYYDYGTASTLTPSVTSLAPAPGDSLKTVLTLNWTDPEYTNPAGTTKYIVQIDTAGRNFSKPTTREITGALSTAFIGKDFNSILIDNLGFQFGRPGTIEVRVISSFANNNQRLNSNVVRLGVTAYKVPPKVTLPATGKLFIVGDATDGGWGNPVPTPSQELTRIDETTFGGIFYLYGGAQYLIIPRNGEWAKYSVANNTIAGAANGGDFGAELRDNFPAPGADGWYKIVLDFQTGKYTVTPFTQQHGLPQALVAVGGATPGGWANNANNPQKFTRLNSTRWELTLDLTGGEKYLLLPEPGSWDKKYGVENNSLESAKLGGFLKPEGQDIPAPATGKYKIEVDFINNLYKLTRQ